MALGTNYKRIGDREDQLIQIRLRLHNSRMQELVAGGMNLGVASKVAFDEVRKMSAKELRRASWK